MTRFKKPGFLKVFDRTEEKEDRPLLDSESGLFTALDLPPKSDLSQKLSAVEELSPIRKQLAPPSISAVSEKRPERAENHSSASPSNLLALGGKTYSNRRLHGKQASERKIGKITPDDLTKHIGELPALTKQPITTDESKGTLNASEIIVRGKEKSGSPESGKASRPPLDEDKASSEGKSKRRFLGRLQQKEPSGDASDSESESDVRRPEYEATVKQVAAVEGADSFAQISLEEILPDLRSHAKSDSLGTVTEESKTSLELGDCEVLETNDSTLAVDSNETTSADEQASRSESSKKCLSDSEEANELTGERLSKGETENANAEVGSNHRKNDRPHETRHNAGTRTVSVKEKDAQNAKNSEYVEKRFEGKDRGRHRRDKTGSKSRAKNKDNANDNTANEDKIELNHSDALVVPQGESSKDSSIEDEILLVLGIKKGLKETSCSSSNAKQGVDGRNSSTKGLKSSSLEAEVMEALGIKEKKDVKSNARSGRKPKRRHSDKGGSAEIGCEDGEDSSQGVISHMLQQDKKLLNEAETKSFPLARPRMLRATSDKTLLSTFDPTMLDERRIEKQPDKVNPSSRSTEAEVLEALTRLRQETIAKKEKTNVLKKDSKNKVRTDRSDKNGRKGKTNFDGGGQKRSSHSQRKRATSDAHRRNDCPSPNQLENGNALSFDTCPNTPPGHSSQSAEHSGKGARRRSIEISPAGAQRSPLSTKANGRRRSLASSPPSPRIAELDARKVSRAEPNAKANEKGRDIGPTTITSGCPLPMNFEPRSDDDSLDTEPQLYFKNNGTEFAAMGVRTTSKGEKPNAKIIEYETEWKRPNCQAESNLPTRLNVDDTSERDARSVPEPLKLGRDVKMEVEQVPFVSMFSMVAEKSSSNIDFDLELETNLGDCSSLKIDNRHLDVVKSLVKSTTNVDPGDRQLSEQNEEGYHVLNFELADSKIRLHESRLQVQRLEKEIRALKDQLATY